jgi:hypothetical protein
MKLINRHRIATLLVAAVTTMALAQGALADPSRGRYADFRRSRGHDVWYVPVVQRWSEPRSYFYRDCQTGRTDAYISNLRPCYGRGARRARVEKVDIASGRVLAAYVWDGYGWCDAGYDGYGGYAGYAGYDDRDDVRYGDVRGYDDRYAWQAANRRSCDR